MGRRALSESRGMTWGQRLIRIAEEAMEELARREFSIERILELATDAAALGYGSIAIAPSRPVDPRNTAAFREVAAELTKQRLRLDWQIRKDRSGRHTFSVLTVSWELADHAGFPFGAHR